MKSMVTHENSRMYFNFDEMQIIVPKEPGDFVSCHFNLNNALVFKLHLTRIVMPGDIINVGGIEGRMEAKVDSVLAPRDER